MAKFRFDHYIDIHWNGYDIVGDGGTIFSIPDQLYEEFESDLRPVEPSLEWTVVNEFLELQNSVSVVTLTAVSPIVVTPTSTGRSISLNANYQTAGTYITSVNGSAPITASTDSAGISTVSITASYATSTHLHDSDYVNVGGDTMSGQLHVSSATTTSTVGFGEIIVAKGTSYGSFTVNAADDHIHIRSKNPIEVLGQSGPTMQGIRARGLGVNSSHTYPTLIDDGITFGEDANLYRVSADALKTDDALEVVGSLTNGGTSVSLSTHTHAYQPAGTYVTAVNGTAPITASTDTAGIVTVGLSASYQTAGTYVTAVNGTAPIAVSTTTAGIASVSLTANLSPTGSVVMWMTATAPSGWLFLDGSTISQATYPALAAVFGVGSGTFALPDMRDRFVGGRNDTALGWANNTGGDGPNVPHSHTTNIAHGHSDTIAVSTHGDHTHTTDPAAVTSGNAGVNTVTAGSGSLGATTSPHTHSVNVAATASGAENTNLTHTVTGGVTALGTANAGSSERAPKSTLLNFIIKT